MDGKLEVLIAGAGVAGLEAAFALRALAAERVAVTVVAPASEFVYRPLAVREPFTHVPAQRYPVSEIVADAGAEFVADAFRWLDGPNRVLHTRAGRELGYDALVLALGARPRPPFKHALILDPARFDAQVSALMADIERGSVRSVAALIPSIAGWPLPLYELSLLIAGHARQHGAQLSLTLATPEEAPLAVFGAPVSAAVSELLEAEGIHTITSASCEVPKPGVVSVRPGINVLEADRIIALPQLFGPSTPGVPKRARGGFLSIDQYCQVRAVDAVYAAGDATEFPVKFGAVAAQQADTAARAIAAAAGADVKPTPLKPVIHGVLLGGSRPLYMTAQLLGRHGSRSKVSAAPTWRLPTKIAARYLAPYLDARDRASAR